MEVQTGNTKGKWVILIAIEIFVLLAVLAWMLLLIFPLPIPVHPQVTVEAGTDSVSVALFQTDPEKPLTAVTDLTALDLNRVGVYEIQLSYKNKPCTSVLTVVDTTPPTAKTKPCQIYNDETLSADAFISEIQDVSVVTVKFARKPDFTQVGDQTVAIDVADESGNVTTVTAALTVIADTVAPVFGELPAITVQVGDSVSYKKDVTVSDDRDGELSFEVDSSLVDLQKAGTYTAVYTAKDKSGNETVAERTITVQEKPVITRELVEELAGKVLAEIVTDSMTQPEKAKAVFRWVRKNFDYVSSPETDVLEAAYVAFTNLKGDCTNYYAATSVLLDLCGIENRRVDRSGGQTDHVWLLVNVGTGWYHMDTSPQSLKDRFQCFMKTDQEVWGYAKSRSDGRTDYYQFDTTLHPERATEKYTG